MGNGRDSVMTLWVDSSSIVGCICTTIVPALALPSCLFIPLYLPACLPVCLPITHSVYLLACLRDCLSICRSLRILTVYLSVWSAAWSDRQPVYPSRLPRLFSPRYLIQRFLLGTCLITTLDSWLSTTLQHFNCLLPTYAQCMSVCMLDLQYIVLMVLSQLLPRDLSSNEIDYISASAFEGFNPQHTVTV